VTYLEISHANVSALGLRVHWWGPNLAAKTEYLATRRWRLAEGEPVGSSERRLVLHIFVDDVVDRPVIHLSKRIQKLPLYG
jgi:hypothetical protein